MNNSGTNLKFYILNILLFSCFGLVASSAYVIGLHCHNPVFSSSVYSISGHIVDSSKLILGKYNLYHIYGNYMVNKCCSLICIEMWGLCIDCCSSAVAHVCAMWQKYLFSNICQICVQWSLSNIYIYIYIIYIYICPP